MKEILSYIISEKFNNAQLGDEFYTQIKDIEKELSYYDLKGKIIYCNCDNPKFSNFYKFFYDNFDKLGIKYLYATYFDKEPKLYEYDGKDVKTSDIESGQFQDNEEIMKKCDIVITNPPFSEKLPNKLVELCIKNKKDFIIVAQLHLIQSKDIFNLYKEDKIKVGYTNINDFVRPDGSKKGAPCCWWTNLEVEHKPIKFEKEYNENDYPKYDSYDAIECNSWKNIPKDYKGNIGVPYRFITKLSHEQFDVVDIIRPKLNKENIMMRLVIKFK